ncbi:unnamed protein product [Thlaspi arvense]|uniref:RNase H type-1 domain-containing protein n=1 Tax=Thlaspi arvense TaxID=13288 RepID=A0AAU9RU40_THLAR|nr:unnamed protein product [Thlaspi arvense]
MIICSDAAWKEDLRAAGLGWTISNQELGLKLARSETRNHVGSPLVAEAMALLAALRHAKTLQLTMVTAFSDSQELIKSLNGRPSDKHLYGVLHDIMSIRDLFSSISFYYVPRKNNGEADSLAKRALTTSEPGLL